jgi:hypothetical protein
MADAFLEMPEANNLQFYSGGNGKIFFAYEDEDEVLPVIVSLMKWLIGDNEIGSSAISGYIRNQSRESVSKGQREFVGMWFSKNVENFEKGRRSMCREEFKKTNYCKNQDIE